MTCTKQAAFVTYGWCRSSYAVIRSLGSKGIPVHVGDASRLAMGRYSKYARSFNLLPDFFSSPDTYVDAVIQAMKRTGAKILLPCHEDIRLFSKYGNTLPTDIMLAVPPFDSYLLADDKERCISQAKTVGCPTPIQIELHSSEDIDTLGSRIAWPIVIKTHRGNSAKGVRIAHNKEEAHFFFNELITKFHLPVAQYPFAQEYLPGKAAGVCLLYDHGICKAQFAEQYQRCKNGGNFGTSTLRTSLENQKLIQDARLLMDSLAWHGLAHLDFIQDAEGTYRLIEVNPRPWGAMWLSIAAGVDFPYLWYLITQQETVSDQPITVTPTSCRWILGEVQAILSLVRSGKYQEALSVFHPVNACTYDDLCFSDPMPFWGQAIDYGMKMLRGGMNPISKGMIE